MVNENNNSEQRKLTWAVFLNSVGQGGMWSKQTLLNFLVEYRDYIVNADGIELLTFLQNIGLEWKLKTSDKFKKLTQETDKNVREELVDDIITETTGMTDEEIADTLTGSDDIDIDEATDDDIDNVEEEEENEPELPKETMVDSMKIIDAEYMRAENLSPEDLRFLIERHINKTWNRIINDKITIDDIKEDKNKKYFTQIRSQVIAEYNEVMNMKNPKGYCFSDEPNIMQKLMACRLKERKMYNNWSGVGSGKTLAAVYAGRYVGAKNTLVVTYNSTGIGWYKSLNSYFDDCVIYDTRNWSKSIKSQLKNCVVRKKHLNQIKFEEGKNNYVVLNYEFFQQGENQKNANYLYEFLDKNRIDYFILDEVHSVKQREEDVTMDIEEQFINGMLSNRRRLMLQFINKLKEKNPDLYFMVATATPIINNLVEAKKLLELLHGENFNDIGTKKNSVKSAVSFHKHIATNGFRYIPEYKTKANTILLPIEAPNLYDELLGKRGCLEIEKVLIDHKLNAIEPYLKKGTIIYTYYVDEIVDKIEAFVKARNFKVAQYTGAQSIRMRNDNKDDFENKKIDILIGSTPIGTGVDGLQHVCDNMIILSLPWTHSDYEQLVGRVIRQGSNFSVVDIVIPKVNISYFDKREGIDDVWSWDGHKLNVINFKRDLFGIVVDGIIPPNIITNSTELKRRSIKSLNDFIESVNNGEIQIKGRTETEKEFLEHSELIIKEKKIHEFKEMNRLWNTSNSGTTFKRLQKNPEEHKKYHNVYRETRKDWEEIPYEVIAEKINKLNKPNHIVADFGCGDNLLKTKILNNVLSFDMGKTDENDDSVIICDVTNLPIEDNSIHIGVFALSLMGKNNREMIKEAKRVIINGGKLFIAEPNIRWEDKGEAGIDEVKNILEAEGFEVIGEIDERKQFFYICAVNTL